MAALGVAAETGASGLELLTMAASTFLPIAILLAAVIGGFAAFKQFDYNNTGWTRAQESMSKAVDDYKSAQSKLESLQNEKQSNFEKVRTIAAKYNVDTTGLDTAEEIIEKIRSSDVKLDLVDEAEINEISRANTAVEAQVKLQEQLAKAKKESMVTATEQAIQAEKSYWEVVKERHGKGFFGTIAAGIDYFMTNGVEGSKRTHVDEFGNLVEYQAEGQKYRENAFGNTTLGLAKQAFEEYKRQKTELDALDKEILEQQGEATKGQMERRQKLQEGLTDTTKNLTDYLGTLSEQADILSDSSSASARSFVKDTEKLFLDFENFGLSEPEQALNTLNHFFDGSAGKNAIKDALEEASKEGANLNDVLGEMGLSLQDLGLNESGLEYLNSYFSDISKNVEDAKSVVDDFRVSVDDVGNATKSANKDNDWKTIQSAYKSAGELLKSGQIGTDDFQTVAQFLSPKNIAKLAQQAKDSGENAAYEYQKAFESARAKADRWFGSDETKSMENFANDMQKAGLVDIDKNYQGRGLWDIQSKFQNTAEAANALGTSVEVVETMLSGLESYGYDFSNIQKSGDMLREYTDNLEALRQVYNQMGEGESKDRIGNLLSGFDEQYKSFSDDLTNLTQEQVVHIKFEYDMAQLQLDIDEIKERIADGMNDSVEQHAGLIYTQDKYISQAKSGLGLDREGITLPVEFVAAANAEKQLKEELKNTTDEDRKLELQAEIENKQEIQKDILDSFSEEHPEITPDVSLDKANATLQDQFGKVVVDAEINTDNIDDFLSSEKGSAITFTANIDGVESEIEAVRNEDGTITYTTEINGETVQEDDLNKFGTITYNVHTEGEKDVAALTEGAEDKSVTVSADTTGKPGVDDLSGAIKAVEPKQVDVSANVSGKGEVDSLRSSISSLHDKTVTIRTIHETVNRTVYASADGTAHARGTAFARGEWGTKGSGVALGGELGRELVVRNGKFFTIGDDGAEMFSYQSGDIIFNAEQTKQIFEKGAITHGKRRGRALAEGTAFLLGSGGSDDDSGSSGSGHHHHHSKKKKKKKKHSSSSSDDDDETRVDWIDVNIDRIEREIKRLKTLADSIYATFSSRNKNLQAEIDAVTSEIKTQQSAYERYLREFESAAKEGKLSESQIEKIKNGTIDIRKYDSDTQKAITEAKKWYDKALDAKDAIDKLKESVSALIKQKFDNVVKKWANNLQNLEHAANIREAKIQNRTTRASEYVGFQTRKNASTSNIKDYRSQINNSNKQIEKLKEERRELKRLLAESLQSGAIKKGSEAYYKMLADIQNVDKSILSLTGKIADYTNNIAQEYRNMFDQILQRSENLRQNLEHAADIKKTKIDNRNNRASDFVNSNRKTNASRQNIKDYKSLTNNANNQLQKLKEERRELNGLLNASLRSGAIKKGSEAYYKMLADIQNVEKAIQTLNGEVIEYTNNIAQEYRNMFDQIAKKSENILSITTHFSTMYSKQLELAQAKGYATSTKYYTKLKVIEENNLNASKQLAKDLQARLNAALRSGSIQRYSQEWYDMTKRINEAKEATMDAAIAMAEYDNKIQKVKWDRFDYLIDRINDVTKESDFLISLMSKKDLFDEKGNATSEGQATFGLHAMNYDVYINEAKRYANEIEKINAQIAKDPNNTELIKRKKELIEATREVILSEQEERQEIKKLIESGIEKQIEYLSELITKYKDALTSKKNLYDYQKNVSEQIDQISSLQKQLSAYSGDKSEESIAKTQKLADSLRKAREELKETEYDKYISDAQDMLDDLKTDYEETLNKRLDNVDKLIKDVVSQVKNDSTKISATITDITDKVGYTLSGDIKSIWKSHDTLLRATNSTLANIYTAVKSLWAYADKKATNDVKSVFTDNQNKNNQEKKAVGSGKSTITKGYATGIQSIPQDQMAWTSDAGQELIYNSKSGAILTPLRKGDKVFTAAMSENLWNISKPDGLEAIIGSMIPDYINSAMGELQSVLNGSQKFNYGNVTQHFDNITFSLPNVKDYDSLVRQMQNDKKFENLIQSMTIGRINGKSSASKRHINI